MVAVIQLGRRLRDTAGEVVLRRTFAVAIVAVALPLQILQFIPSEWDLQTRPLLLAPCDDAWLFAVHALWTRNALSATVTYLWGITLTTQGIFTPYWARSSPQLGSRCFGPCTC